MVEAAAKANHGGRASLMGLGGAVVGGLPSIVTAGAAAAVVVVDAAAGCGWVGEVVGHAMDGPVEDTGIWLKTGAAGAAAQHALDLEG